MLSLPFFASKKQRRDFMSGFHRTSCWCLREKLSQTKNCLQGGLLRVLSGVITPIMVLSMGHWGEITLLTVVISPRNSIISFQVSPRIDYESFNFGVFRLRFLVVFPSLKLT